jgi:hypothetical protein
VADKHVAACEELQIGRQRHAHLHGIPCHVGYHAVWDIVPPRESPPPHQLPLPTCKVKVQK